MQSPLDPPCSPVQQTTFGTLAFGLAHRRAFSASPFSPWHSSQLSFILRSSNYFSALLNFICFSSQFPEDPSSSGNIRYLYGWINPDTHEPCVFTYRMGIISFCISWNYYKDLLDHICKVPSCVQWMLEEGFLLPVPHPRPTSQTKFNPYKRWQDWSHILWQRTDFSFSSHCVWKAWQIHSHDPRD